MSAQGTNGLPPIQSWQAQTLRLTAFPIPVSPTDDYGWWSALTGETPETRVVQARQNTRREEGPFHGGRLVNEIRPIRIDWLFIPPQEAPAGDSGFAFIGSFAVSIQPFAELMLRWLDFDTCADLQRLAFGADLFLPVENKVSGYELLSKYVHSVKLDIQHSSDFHYQINRPRKSISSIADLTVNRLTRWSVASGQMVEFVLGAEPRTYIDTTTQRFACHLQLDINTDQRRQTELPREKLHQLLEELIDLANEIVMNGDIP